MGQIIVATKSAVTLAGAQTLSNKTITSPIINSILTAATDGATLTLVARNLAGETQTVLTVVGAATIANSYITAQVGGTWTLVGTWTLPAFTLGGTLNANSQAITNVANLTLLDGYSVSIIGNTVGLILRGGTDATGTGAAILLYGKDHASGGEFSVRTPNLAKTADVVRLTFSGGVATAVATWAAITHTGIVITSAGLVEGAGTGANGFKIKNPKNAAATALSGTQLDVEIDIGGVPYYFTCYPTKA